MFLIGCMYVCLNLSNSDCTSLTAVMAASIVLIASPLDTSVIGWLEFVFADNMGVLMVFAVVFGLVCSSCVALMSPITAIIVGFERFPTYWSLNYIMKLSL
ncbi:hypothetical protein BDB00DRAFT_790673 [Zychaea mexicana]|uniref:uncharacterized protein n=1 Tax=Zychaea mexicana TaxID=64656 RepID=UPI0022FEF1E2|nr:uncharacterized protein BDB00DRAFT_790673 [Zychaea mexicana]KAI9489958.1 hypothetical protein BDB00DRAFT_790673 [Zychaea mexicana]